MEMNSCNLQQNALEALCEALKFNPKCGLKTLSIWKNSIEKNGWQTLIDFLLNNKTSLKQIEFTAEDLSPAQATFLSNWNSGTLTPRKGFV